MGCLTRFCGLGVSYISSLLRLSVAVWLLDFHHGWLSTLLFFYLLTCSAAMALLGAMRCDANHSGSRRFFCRSFSSFFYGRAADCDETASLAAVIFLQPVAFQVITPAQIFEDRAHPKRNECGDSVSNSPAAAGWLRTPHKRGESAA